MIDLSSKEIEYLMSTAPDIFTGGKGKTDFTEKRGGYELGGEFDRNWIVNKFLISKPEFFHEIIGKMRTFNNIKRQEKI